MFAEQKKDYYSVNADIAIEANQQQRNFEYAQRSALIQQEYQTMGMGNNFDDSQNQTQDGMMDQGYMDPMQQEIMEQQNMQLMMLDETMNGPQAVRYDEVYYPRTDKRSIKGNQYTYKGNEYFKETQNDDNNAVNDTVNNAIGNQEIGKSPIEYTNQLSRAKIYDMKSIRVADQVRSYNNLYQDSIPLSNQHELQRYGKRAAGLDSSKRVNKAVFMNKIVQMQQQNSAHHQMQAPVEPVPEQVRQEEQYQEEADRHHPSQPGQMHGEIEDDESAATEMADGAGMEAVGAIDETAWEKVVNSMWQEYDKDNSGFLEKHEMWPLCKAALSEVGSDKPLTQAVVDEFFAAVDSDGNGMVDKAELLRFMQSLM